MKSTNYYLKTKTLLQSMPEIVRLLPTACAFVRGSKNDTYDIFIHTKDGKTSGKWSRVSKLALKLGWAEKPGSNLLVMDHEADEF